LRSSNTLFIARCVKYFKNGNTEIADQPVMVACEKPVLRETKKNQWVDQKEVTRDYYRNIAETGIRHAIQEIVESLGYWKIFAQCFLYC
jgi:hypothetical protein